MVKNPSDNEATWVDPWSGTISCAEQLSPCTTTTEPRFLEPVLWKNRGLDEALALKLECSLSCLLRSPSGATKTKHSQKKAYSNDSKCIKTLDNHKKELKKTLKQKRFQQILEDSRVNGKGFTS